MRRRWLVRSCATLPHTFTRHIYWSMYVTRSVAMAAVWHQLTAAPDMLGDIHRLERRQPPASRAASLL